MVCCKGKFCQNLVLLIIATGCLLSYLSYKEVLTFDLSLYVTALLAAIAIMVGFLNYICCEAKVEPGPEAVGSSS
ncbi:hypothetical protein L596_021944 [Steinernema carpocapsae]|uniref:Uncharacterized protein n=1 Tax=Steinernema carpocapsae TaxID=34508 RepID=A0A4U5MKB9_STECR|nr:hypothetical protein L596_021944 [Steinernema carpocapsae]